MRIKIVCVCIIYHICIHIPPYGIFLKYNLNEFQSQFDELMLRDFDYFSYYFYIFYFICGFCSILCIHTEWKKKCDATKL